jgi:hypothetical protein
MWEPWIGKDYERTRILLLGESCYCWWSEDETVLEWPEPNHPTNVVSWMIDHFESTRNNKFSKMLTRSLTNEYWPERSARSAAWNQVAFTNYVPVAMQPEAGKKNGARIRPSREQWASAREEFPQLLSMLTPRPRVIFVLGYELWNNLPSENWRENPQGYLLSDGQLARCVRCKHPGAPGQSCTIIREQMSPFLR